MLRSGIYRMRRSTTTEYCDGYGSSFRYRRNPAGFLRDRNAGRDSAGADGDRPADYAIHRKSSGWRSLWIGVIYDADEESVLILTAGHVLDQNTGEILVTFPDDTQARAALRAIAVNSDLAFLRVDKKELDPDGEYPTVATDRERFDQLEVYEDVWMYGGDNTKPIYAFVVNPWIYVEDFEQYMLLLQGLPEPGMSGGGAFTEDGVFLGILCGADEEGKVAVVPYSIIESERAGLDNP